MSIPTTTVSHSGATVHCLLLRQSTVPEPDGTTIPGFLAASEREQFEALTVPKRRADWLLGRWTAKQLVHSVVAGGPPDDAALRQIVIARRADGSPYVVTEGGARMPLTLSISHSRGHAFCAAIAGAERPLGADIEFVEARSPLFATDYFTEAELATLPPDLPDAERDLLVTAVWSGKEAALKAVRAGLTVDTRTISCLFDTLAVTGESWSPFRIVWRPGAAAAARPALEGLWQRSGPFVLTLALPAANAAPQSQA